MVVPMNNAAAAIGASEFFSMEEFKGREDEVLATSEILIRRLDQYRKLLQYPIHPSPVPGALARFDGSPTSRHYAVDRWSDAIDVFPEGPFFKAFLLAVSCGQFGGVGIYPATRFRDRAWPMLHLDLRPSLYPTVWARRHDGSYCYPYKHEALAAQFQSLLASASEISEIAAFHE